MAPAPANGPIDDAKDAVSWKPAIDAVVSTLGLKSRIFLRLIIP